MLKSDSILIGWVVDGNLPYFVFIHAYFNS